MDERDKVFEGEILGPNEGLLLDEELHEDVKILYGTKVLGNGMILTTLEIEWSEVSDEMGRSTSLKPTLTQLVGSSLVKLSKPKKIMDSQKSKYPGGKPPRITSSRHK